MNTKKLKFLLVEDDPYFSHQVKKIVEGFGECQSASHLNQAQYYLENNNFDVLLTDLNLTKTSHDLQGLEVLKLAQSKDIYSIVLSSFEDTETIKKVYELGCHHFLDKNKYDLVLAPYLQRVQQKLSSQNWKSVIEQSFVTKDPALIRNLNNLFNMNLKNGCLLLSGETGVGKTHFAKSFHDIINPGKKFVAFNCSQQPEGLIDSLLFGHKKGAFTGANEDYPGLLERADQGTLFLDEIATMPAYTQQKLLKAIEEKEFTPIGDKNPRKVEFTLVSATCENLKEKVEHKLFRKDLLYRISGFELNIPPLRERPKDIEQLIYHFIALSPRRFFIESNVIDRLSAYSWPGNTRELKKTIENLSHSQFGIIDDQNALLPTKSVAPKPLKTLNKDQENMIYQLGLTTFIKSLEKQIVKDALNKANGKKIIAIKDLKISNSTFYRILKDN